MRSVQLIFYELLFQGKLWNISLEILKNVQKLQFLSLFPQNQEKKGTSRPKKSTKKHITKRLVKKKHKKVHVLFKSTLYEHCTHTHTHTQRRATHSLASTVLVWSGDRIPSSLFLRVSGARYRCPRANVTSSISDFTAVTPWNRSNTLKQELLTLKRDTCPAPCCTKSTPPWRVRTSKWSPWTAVESAPCYTGPHPAIQASHPAAQASHPSAQIPHLAREHKSSHCAETVSASCGIKSAPIYWLHSPKNCWPIPLASVANDLGQSACETLIYGRDYLRAWGLTDFTDLKTCDCAICSPPLETLSAALLAVFPNSSANSFPFRPSSLFSASWIVWNRTVQNTTHRNRTAQNTTHRNRTAQNTTHRNRTRPLKNTPTIEQSRKDTLKIVLPKQNITPKKHAQNFLCQQ